MTSTAEMPVTRFFERRFRAVSLLKSGQGVETWLGTDGLGQGPIIIKSVTAATFPASAQHRVRNQARLLAEVQSGLISSPLHVGTEGPLLYVATPFVHGVTLDERLRRGNLSVVESVQLGCWLMTALGEIHRRGVLHRDVKPSNLVVNDSGELKRLTLTDFGIARSDRIDPAAGDQQAATIRYLSPERAGLLETGSDERSDLYSAGVVLFECLAGRPLFTGLTISELVRQTMTETPPDLRTLGIAVPGALDGVLQRLLRKDPRDRYHSAEGVLADLTAVGQALERGDGEPTIVIGSRDLRPTITEPAFTGRVSELRALAAEVELARGGQGRLMLVEAESGGGKTRLLEELALRSGRDALVLRGQGVVDQAARPFQMLVGFSEQVYSAARAEPRFKQAVRDRLGEEAAAACAALPELDSLLGTDDQEQLGPEAFGEARTVNALSSLLDALGTAARPALIIFEDAQWADELTLKLLRQWQGHRRPGRGNDHVAIVVSFRSEEVPAGHPLRGIETATALMLAPLSSQDIRRMAESMAGALPEDALKVAESLSGGSPFMVSAVLRGMVECGALVPAVPRWRVEPLALEDVRSSRQAAVFLGRRLERLAAPALDLLSVGAVLGKEFDLDFAAQLAEQSPASASIALEQVRRRHIVWIRGGGARCAFVHDKLREALLGRLSEPRRQELHRKAALAIEAQDRNRCYEIAYHYDAAGEPQRALSYALAAGDAARARHALDVAEQQYRIAARGSADADGATRLRVAEGLGDILLLRGLYDLAALQLGEARALATGALDRSRLEGKLGDLAFKRGDIDNACAATERALAYLGRPVPARPLTFLLACLREAAVQVLHTLLPRLFLGRRSLRDAEAELLAMRLHSRLAHAYWFGRGRVACAWTHLRGMNLAERYPPTAELAQAYSEHAPVMTMLPAFERGIAYAQKSLAIRRDLGDLWGQGQSLHFYGVVLYGASRFQECITSCTEAMRLLERTGDRWELNTAAWHVAFSQYRLGDLRGALASAQRVYRDGVSIGDAQATGISLGAWSKSTRGDVPADALARELDRVGADVHTASEVLQAEALRLLRAGRPGEAVARLDRADQLVSARGLRQEYVSPVLPWLATALRQEAEATPAWAPNQRRRLLRRSARVVRRALAIARHYQNNLPHALREAGLLAAMQGRTRRAIALLQQSDDVADRQAARYERALTRVALAQIAPTLGVAHADINLAAAQQEVDAVEGVDSRAAGAGAEGAVTLSLAERFDQIVDQGRNIAAALSKTAVIAAAREAGLVLLRGDHSVIIEINRTDDGLAVAHVPENAGMVSRTIISRAIDEAKPLVVGDFDAVGGRPEGTDQTLGITGVRSVLCAPIFVRGWPVACLYVTHSHIGELFGHDEERLAQYLTTLAGAAWQNAEGFSRVEDAVQVRDEFLAIASHELKTPLTSLRLHLEKIQRSMVRGGATDAVLGIVGVGVEKIGRQAERLTKLVDELLDVSRISGGHLKLQPENVDLVRLMRDLLQRFGDEAKKAGCDVSFEAPPSVCGRWDSLRVEQVVTNLMTNAIKYSPGHPIEVRLSVGPGHVQIEVRDHGIGLDPRDAARIFDRFERAVSASHYGGLGLGLYIARQIVKAHGGEISVDSKPNQGATFTVTLPYNHAEGAAVAALVQEHSAAGLR